MTLVILLHYNSLGTSTFNRYQEFLVMKKLVVERFHCIVYYLLSIQDYLSTGYGGE